MHWTEKSVQLQSARDFGQTRLYNCVFFHVSLHHWKILFYEVLCVFRTFYFFNNIHENISFNCFHRFAKSTKHSKTIVLYVSRHFAHGTDTGRTGHPNIYIYTIRSFSVAFQNSKTERPKRHPDGSVVWLANLNLDAENSIPCLTWAVRRRLTWKTWPIYGGSTLYKWCFP